MYTHNLDDFRGISVFSFWNKLDSGLWHGPCTIQELVIDDVFLFTDETFVSQKLPYYKRQKSDQIFQYRK